MSGVSNAAVKQAVVKAAREHTQHLAGSVDSTREIVTHEAEGLKAHGNEKAGDADHGSCISSGQCSRQFAGSKSVSTSSSALQPYADADAKLDAFSRRSSRTPAGPR